MGRTSSWGPVTWGRSSVYAQEDGEKGGNYFSTAFKSAKQKVGDLKWPQLDSEELMQSYSQKLLPYPTPPLSVASASTSSSVPEIEADELPLPSQAEGEPQEEVQSLPHPTDVLSVSETFEDFKADKEAKLNEWLEGTYGNDEEARRKEVV
ncbi:hypothetical protein CFOL_v3_29856 [Cephalotus follicularis]|uniref:Uncharacterized protein n=1 Tax=Cephalotus follicularis TaxID=3775 RepID=A0A1Q3D1U9_CEPFO|nr:hypothetical protein CFOL_v3_29856 [Cephalotus follicularis]